MDDKWRKYVQSTLGNQLVGLEFHGSPLLLWRARFIFFRLPTCPISYNYISRLQSRQSVGFAFAFAFAFALQRSLSYL